MIVRCYVCGTEERIEYIKGSDGRLYIEIQSKVLFRIRTPEYLCVICKDCAKYLDVVR